MSLAQDYRDYDKFKKDVTEALIKFKKICFDQRRVFSEEIEDCINESQEKTRR